VRITIIVVSKLKVSSEVKKEGGSSEREVSLGLQKPPFQEVLMQIEVEGDRLGRLTFHASIILESIVASALLTHCFCGLPSFTHTLRQYIIWVVQVGVNLLNELKLFSIYDRRTVMLGSSVHTIVQGHIFNLSFKVFFCILVPYNLPRCSHAVLTIDNEEVPSFDVVPSHPFSPFFTLVEFRH
jgi:hypothetical protein